MKSWKPWFEQKAISERRKRATAVCVVCGGRDAEAFYAGEPVHQICVLTARGQEAALQAGEAQ